MYKLHEQRVQHPSNPLLLIHFEAMEEYADPSKHFSDLRDLRRIYEQQKKGNSAAWFSARICVRVAGTEVIGKASYLGCCSYNSFDEFLDSEKNYYFKDLVREATESLLSSLDEEIGKAETTLKNLKSLRGTK